MPGQGRLGDKANIKADAHGCPGCPHPGTGPAIVGSGNVFVNGRPALRVDDLGIQAACCGGNTWQAQAGSATVFINGKPAFRRGDATRHCGGTGKLVEGSDDVFVGDAREGGRGGTGGATGGTSGGTAHGGAGMSGAGSGDQPGGGRAPDGGGGAPDGRWIEIELRSRSGAAMAGVRYRIVKPDGTVVEGRLDANGRARVDDLDPGACRVSFPDLDGGEWR